MFWRCVKASVNFYRLHFLAFTVVPLVGATILWASNGEFYIKFIDSLYISVSGATGTGLVTVDLSALTIWQQVVLVILELIGNQAFVAWVVVLVRRWYFLRNLRHIVSAEMERDHTTQCPQDVSPSLRHIRETLARFKEAQHANDGTARTTPFPSRGSSQNRGLKTGLRADMVRRLDVAPHPIDPMGSQARRVSTDRLAEASGIDVLSSVASRRSRRTSILSAPPPVHQEDEFGGLPSIQDMLTSLARKISPRLERRLKRTLTVPRTETLVPQAAGAVTEDANAPVKRVPYLSFSATVKRNSSFYGLTTENIEELGGVEYRALCSLSWVIPAYYLGLLGVSFIVTAPYMSMPRWQENYLPPLQHKVINSVWFSAFQIVGAWANTGMSLVDQNMVPFQTAYPMIIFIVICVLAGNTCLPIFLRLFIWLLTKLPGRSRTKESLHFLLDHPRRCTIYLFPSRQTWLLLGTVMLLNCTNLFFYLVLDIGNDATDSLPFGVKFVDAVLDAAACRNAGYQPIPMSSLMPAVQVLSVVMMYIAIYPIAMSVRSTNVYEANSLGVYESDNEDDEINDDAHWDRPSESRVAIWGRYLMRHARRQLSFDMWWLAVSLFLLCIIERPNLTDTSKQSYFNIFALLFELVSAYGTVGLSLGIPGFNYSLSGEMHTLSKLIVCAVMLRGRHRGLPVALDRAVLMPSEFLVIHAGSQQQSDDGQGMNEKESEDGRMGHMQVLHDPDELATRMRLRTRTISLIVEERRESPGKEAGWAPDRVPEESRDASVGSAGSERNV
ncbi:TrkH-domain-containing protein [Trametes versicolor FP-101664 SS1]|uniref:TrkH-domain-containing protein n=1 Tax=Trametes versicolor (strain FP-101664) TaxID=717944 RepID=UPI0004621241|nr:TrkH-domain-containing protein [Trametes versicolor FP-101664 SS1]EIW52424.1 TrkH-domain-containing protein [Trametes versicolor FP-101664 SS1]